ncbi:MAG: hypothetical protein WC812_03190 [Candidatus Pacearchaeota archaeon]|jgi:uncharacterized membrane protein YeaQ/YmgE (transglycosylase-associated protein family)
MKINKKEKILFWNAILAGIIGGVIGNFWVGSYFNMVSQNYNWMSLTTFIIFSLIFLITIILASNIIKKINKK